MRNEENIDHIVRDQQAITNLLLTYIVAKVYSVEFVSIPRSGYVTNGLI